MQQLRALLGRRHAEVSLRESLAEPVQEATDEPRNLSFLRRRLMATSQMETALMTTLLVGSAITARALAFSALS
jgi:hypothetical protein